MHRKIWGRAFNRFCFAKRFAHTVRDKINNSENLAKITKYLWQNYENNTCKGNYSFLKFARYKNFCVNSFANMKPNNFWGFRKIFESLHCRAYSRVFTKNYQLFFLIVFPRSVKIPQLCTFWNCSIKEVMYYPPDFFAKWYRVNMYTQKP
jgi:hypothetical protein